MVTILKKLAICIPTFNRSEQVINQIKFFFDEINVNDNVDIYVRDNCSNFEQYSELLEFHKQFDDKFFLSRNESNVGLVGNLLLLFSSISTSYEYVWFVGDDDTLCNGIVNKILGTADSNDELIFINHSGIENEVCVMESAIPISILNRQKKLPLIDVFKFSGTTMMFVTACVYRVDILKKAIHSDSFTKNRLTAPLYWSFYCGQNGVSYITDIFIKNKRGNTSWDSKSHIVFGIWLPLELFRLPLMHYDKISSIKIAFRYLPTAIKRLVKFSIMKVTQ